ncbi:MAG: hypothetical protein AVDCRST_MAG19-1966 [uncultured Thermomicrobiales bacterium]|uniref:Uncharacterized protein n=1 Tax=uncultured Thermomicrobiales bacterium TaxID=1645740 RepID=A0A6J4V251_9BACT|nr:MAG: hypothetical protein AVDCRST_MAG19-1966 [uncultured Thermomicrobiales bacterium]
MGRVVERRTVLAVVGAAGLALGLGGGAGAYPPPGQGEGTDTNEASRACSAAVVRQQQAGLQGSGAKRGGEAPTNCDHYWQNEGFIGRDFTPAAEE